MPIDYYKKYDVSANASLAYFELQSSLARAVIDASPEGILVVNENGVVVCVNQQFIDVWRVPSHILRSPDPDQAIGTEDNSILYDALNRVKNKEAFLARVQELYKNPHLNDHCEIELTDGRTLERHSTALYNAEGKYLGRVWFFLDISSVKKTESVLQKMAYQDSLTGIANRRYLLERADQEFARSKRHSAKLSIIALDIDHFKQVNDNYGHVAGDAVLKSLCDTCRRLLREEDIFGRIGGEEFAILLPDTDINNAASLAERLRLETSGIFVPIGEGEISITISLGVATLAEADLNIEECLLRADKAMYRAKQGGRNKVELEA